MKPQLHKLPVSSEFSFLYKIWECKYFDKPWHFHKEYELVLINKSEGTRFVGSDVSSFKNGDLCLIGSDIPHLFRNNEKYYKSDEENAQSIFIHFTWDFIGKSFFDLPEMKQVKSLLDKSQQVLEFYGKTSEQVKSIMHRMSQEGSAYKLVSLLEILIHLSTSIEIKTILPKSYTGSYGMDTNKINRVFQFIMKNFSNRIYINEIASELNMSVPSFSRYFKHHTRRTFSDYVTEIRICNACRLLMDNEHSVSDICYFSGFDNLSNFYRHFKRHTGMIPKEYKKRFLNNAEA